MARLTELILSAISGSAKELAFNLDGVQQALAANDPMFNPASPLGDFGRETMMLEIETAKVDLRDEISMTLEKAPSFDWLTGVNAVELAETGIAHLEEVNRALWFAHLKLDFEIVL
jgi:hypothetical protein